ncbi:citrate synthase [Nonomuraea fuscirosea]|uniref:citrate synthase n=2 Tax=Nonomuraea fuscirosea TaxID=1291556 RepID=UPI0033CA5DB9
MAEWIDAATASERLGIKPATLYAYVSRGVLQRRHGEDGRRSLFSAEEIERLARRGRPRNQRPELVIESAITALGVDRPYYRGLDILSLAGLARFETVAEWLWTGDPTVWPPTRPTTLNAPTASTTAPSTSTADPGIPAGSAEDPVASAGGPGSLRTSSGGPADEVVPTHYPNIARNPGASTGDHGPTIDPGLPGDSGASSGDLGTPVVSTSDAGKSRGTASFTDSVDVPDGAPVAGEHGARRGRGPEVGGRRRMAAPAAWRCEPEALEAAVAAQRGLPADLLPLDRLQVITTVLGASDSLRHQLDPASVTETGRRMIAGLVDALPQLSEPSGDSIAARLWSRLCPSPATPALLTALEGALVLLADHELAASTLAARVAASAKADPYAVVLTGLGVLGGPLHGGASYGAERLLAEIAAPHQAARVVTERVRRGERIPGFGHSVYKNGDARGALLLDLVRTAAPGHERIAAGDALLAEMRRRRLPDRNVDFALAVLTAVTGMVSGAGEAIFAVARAAGWLAHAMEEYHRGSLLRLRASYTGPPTK